MSCVDVFLFFFWEDFFFLVMMEVGVCKFLVVGFDGFGGVIEFVELEVGLFVFYLNLEVMVEKIVIFYNNISFRKEMGENVYWKVNEFYNEIVFVLKIL